MVLRKYFCLIIIVCLHYSPIKQFKMMESHYNKSRSTSGIRDIPNRGILKGNPRGNVYIFFLYSETQRSLEMSPFLIAFCTQS